MQQEFMGEFLSWTGIEEHTLGSGLIVPTFWAAVTRR